MQFLIDIFAKFWKLLFGKEKSRSDPAMHSRRSLERIAGLPDSASFFLFEFVF